MVINLTNLVLVFSLFLLALNFDLQPVNGKALSQRTRCNLLIKQASIIEKQNLIAAKSMLEAQLSQARLRLNLPKAPQLRTRFENTLDQEKPEGRVGLRWYFPRFNFGQNLLTSLRRFSLNEKDLLSRWIILKQQDLLLSKLRVYLKYQSLMMTQLLYVHQEQLAQAELSLSKSLLESGMSTLLKHKSYQKKLSQLHLKKRQVDVKIRRFSLKYTWFQTHLITPTSSPELLVDCLPELHSKSLEDSFNKSRRQSAMQSLSLAELELLIKITLQEQKSKLNDHQWFEFFEVNYDQSLDSQGLIAELGINLPIGHDHEVAQLTSQNYIQQLEQLRNARKQALAENTLSYQMLEPLFKPLTPLKAIPTSDLRGFDEIENAYLKLELWHLAWLERYELELLALEYLSLWPGLMTSE